LGGQPEIELGAEYESIALISWTTCNR